MSVYFNRHQIPRLPYPLRTTKSSQTGGVCPTVVQTSFLDLISYWPTQYHSMSSQCYILSLVAVKKHLRCLPPRALQHQRPLPCVPWIQTPPSGARSVCHYLPLYATWPPKKKNKSVFFGIGSYLRCRSNLNVAHVIQRWSISYHFMPRAPYESLANHSTLHRCSEDLKSVLLTTDGHDYLLCSGRPCAGTVSICSIKQ